MMSRPLPGRRRRDVWMPGEQHPESRWSWQSPDMWAYPRAGIKCQERDRKWGQALSVHQTWTRSEPRRSMWPTALSPPEQSASSVSIGNSHTAPQGVEDEQRGSFTELGRSWGPWEVVNVGPSTEPDGPTWTEGSSVFTTTPGREQVPKGSGMSWRGTWGMQGSWPPFLQVGEGRARKAISPVPGPEHEGYLKSAPDSIHLIVKYETRAHQSHSESALDRGAEPLQGVYMLPIAEASQRPRKAWPAEKGKLRSNMGTQEEVTHRFFISVSSVRVKLQLKM